MGHDRVMKNKRTEETTMIKLNKNLFLTLTILIGFCLVQKCNGQTYAYNPYTGQVYGEYSYNPNTGSYGYSYDYGYGSNYYDSSSYNSTYNSSSYDSTYDSIEDEESSSFSSNEQFTLKETVGVSFLLILYGIFYLLLFLLCNPITWLILILIAIANK